MTPLKGGCDLAHSSIDDLLQCTEKGGISPLGRMV